jgi:hypothetical protein
LAEEDKLQQKLDKNLTRNGQGEQTLAKLSIIRSEKLWQGIYFKTNEH